MKTHVMCLSFASLYTFSKHASLRHVIFKHCGQKEARRVATPMARRRPSSTACSRARQLSCHVPWGRTFPHRSPQHLG